MPEDNVVLLDNNIGANINGVPVVAPVMQLDSENNNTYKISFDKYKKRKCEIEDIDKVSYLRKIVGWFKSVGMATSVDELPNSEPVYNVGKYTFLFEGLEEDVEIKEYKAGGKCRIFYYRDEGNKLIQCILIKNAHVNI